MHQHNNIEPVVYAPLSARVKLRAGTNNLFVYLFFGNLFFDLLCKSTEMCACGL